MVNRFEVHMVTLDPTVGSEIRKTRPCMVVSPDEVNHHSRTVIVAPMTTRGHPGPMRVPCTFKNKSGRIVLDHLRAVDKSRLIKRVGVMDSKTSKHTLRVLMEMFAP